MNQLFSLMRMCLAVISFFIVPQSGKVRVPVFIYCENLSISVLFVCNTSVELYYCKGVQAYVYLFILIINNCSHIWDGTDYSLFVLIYCMWVNHLYILYVLLIQ